MQKLRIQQHVFLLFRRRTHEFPDKADHPADAVRLGNSQALHIIRLPFHVKGFARTGIDTETALIAKFLRHRRIGHQG